MIVASDRQNMGNEHEQNDRLLDEDDQEVGADVADDTEAFLALLPHYYRGEVTQATSAHDRIDQTTNWQLLS